MARRYRDRRAEAVISLGGVCVICGTTDQLELDHIDRTTKSFEISKIWNSVPGLFWEEVRKCQLLCDPCHNLKTLDEKGQKPARGTHGTLSAYRYCRCQTCLDAMAEYNRNNRVRWRRPGLTPRTAPQHGEQRMYRVGCRCDICKGGNTSRHRAWADSKKVSSDLS